MLEPLESESVAGPMPGLTGFKGEESDNEGEDAVSDRVGVLNGCTAGSRRFS